MNLIAGVVMFLLIDGKEVECGMEWWAYVPSTLTIDMTCNTAGFVFAGGFEDG